MYQLFHPLDRPGQEEAWQFIEQSKKKYIFLSLPTGLGKTALAAKASEYYRTLALVQTKSLQSDNYDRAYGFEPLYGKGNYPCSVLKTDILFVSADDCNEKCESHRCRYYQEYKKCQFSKRTVLNYAKFLHDKPFAKGFNPEIVFMDEAHILSDIVCNYSGLTIKWSNEFLSGIPKIYSGSKRQLSPIEAMHLLSICSAEVSQVEPKIKFPRSSYRDNVTRDLEPTKENLAKAQRWRYLSLGLSATIDSINDNTLDWFFLADEEKLVLKPLTAKYNFSRLFDVADKLVLMSATLGNCQVLANELGIEDYDYYQAPNPWPVPLRLVIDMLAPKMNYKASENDKDEQAQIIAEQIDLLPSHWTGIIHTSSFRQSQELADRLEMFGHSCLMPDAYGTDSQLKQWQKARSYIKLCISPNFHEGVDLADDQINIVAKVPFGNLKGEYDKARLEYNQQMYTQRAAWLLEQACGRTRRGVQEHYTDGRFVGIADGSWHRVKSLLSDSFRMSIR
jgi:Rad3-related DNA helicase